MLLTLETRRDLFNVPLPIPSKAWLHLWYGNANLLHQGDSIAKNTLQPIWFSNQPPRLARGKHSVLCITLYIAGKHVNTTWNVLLAVQNFDSFKIELQKWDDFQNKLGMWSILGKRRARSKSSHYSPIIYLLFENHVTWAAIFFCMSMC